MTEQNLGASQPCPVSRTVGGAAQLSRTSRWTSVSPGCLCLPCIAPCTHVWRSRPTAEAALLHTPVQHANVRQVAGAIAPDRRRGNTMITPAPPASRPVPSAPVAPIPCRGFTRQPERRKRSEPRARVHAGRPRRTGARAVGHGLEGACCLLRPYSIDRSGFTCRRQHVTCALACRE